MIEQPEAKPKSVESQPEVSDETLQEIINMLEECYSLDDLSKKFASL
ncbi:MAG TPA: hypothetical protein VFX17_01315 [Patescibacteria group bacterium]|nr:hypothetical protein [Patescibacteria group bacterium]